MYTWMKRSLTVAIVAVTAIAAVSVTPVPASARNRNGNAAAAIAMFGIVAGTIASIAAADARRSEWEARQRYYYGGYSGYGGYPPPPPRYHYRCRYYGAC